MNPIVYDYGFSSVRDKEVRELIRVAPVLRNQKLGLIDVGPRPGAYLRILQ